MVEWLTMHSLRLSMVWQAIHPGNQECNSWGALRGGAIILPNHRKKVHIFLKKIHFFQPRPEKYGPLHVYLWKTRAPTWKKCLPLGAIFLKKWTSTWEMWRLCVIFWKNGPRTKNMDLLRTIFLKNVDLHIWFPEKSEPWPEKCKK